MPHSAPPSETSLPVSEAQIVAEIMLSMSRIGALVQRNNSGLFPTADGRRVRAATPGAADILCCYQGLFIAIECKSARGRQSNAQKRYQAAVERAGGIYILARNYETVLDIIREIDPNLRQSIS